jgi:hypothetical protein
MHRFSAIIVAGLLAGAGCRTASPPESFAPWGNAAEARGYLDQYRHVLMACIYDDHWEDRGPHEYSFHHFKGTVVRPYKGAWRTSERIAFVHGVDAPAHTTSNTDAGSLVFLFTNEHTNGEVGIDTGDFLSYEPNLERLIRSLYAERSSL